MFKFEGRLTTWQTARTVEGHLLVLVAHTIQDDEEDGSRRVIRIIRPDGLTGGRQRYEQEFLSALSSC